MISGLDSAADELYSLAPTDLDRFNARRTELVAAARAGGDRELARAIGALRKPVQAAALVNALAHRKPAELARLADLGGRLRNAHRQLRGDQLRELSEERQRSLNRLVKLAQEVAGRAVGETVLGQLRATFEAAIADPAAEQAVRSGRLTAALSYSGFGEVDLSEAVAVPRRLTAVPDLPAAGSEPAATGSATGSVTESAAVGPATADLAELRRAERAVKKAESVAEAADEAVRAAADRLAEARRSERELQARIDQLTAELAAARQATGAASRETAAAEREHGRAERAAERAEQARQLAMSDANRLGAPG